MPYVSTYYDLNALAERIRVAHKNLMQAAVSHLQHARRAGELLLAVKESLPRGRWQ